MYRTLFLKVAIINLVLFMSLQSGLFSQEITISSDSKSLPVKSTQIAPAAIDTMVHISRAPVIVLHDTLLYIYGDVGAVTAAKRSLIISKNIETLCRDALFIPDSLVVDSLDMNIYRLRYMDDIILGVTDYQSLILKKPKSELITQYRQSILNKINYEKSHNGFINLLIQIIMAIVVVIVSVLLIRGLNYIFRLFRKFIALQRKHTVKALYYIIDSDKQIKLAISLVKIIRLLLIVTVLYLFIFALFRIFPETKWLSDTLIGYIISPISVGFHSFFNYIPKLITIIVTLFVFRFIFKIVRLLANQIESGAITIKGFYKDWAIPTYNIIKVVMMIFIIILIFPNLPGADSDIFKGVSVFLGILLSLGSTSIIGNVVSGLVITYMRPFKGGDHVKIGDVIGNVIEKSPLVTRLKTTKNEIVTIPNAIMMSAQTVNYTKSAEDFGLVLYKTVTIGYEVPWPKVHELLIEAALNTPRVMKKMKPFVLQTALEDFYIEYQINIYTREANFIPSIYSDLYKNIQDVFNREGIELLSPHYHAHRDGSQPMMPPEMVKEYNFKGWPLKVKVENNLK